MHRLGSLDTPWSSQITVSCSHRPFLGFNNQHTFPVWLPWTSPSRVASGVHLSFLGRAKGFDFWSVLLRKVSAVDQGGSCSEDRFRSMERNRSFNSGIIAPFKPTSVQHLLLGLVKLLFLSENLFCLQQKDHPCLIKPSVYT